MTGEKRPESENLVLLGWDPREFLWLAERVRNRLLAFGRRIIRAPCRLIDRLVFLPLVNRSRFKDPRYVRINGHWVRVDHQDELVGQLEELVEEASR